MSSAKNVDWLLSKIYFQCENNGVFVTSLHQFCTLLLAVLGIVSPSSGLFNHLNFSSIQGLWTSVVVINHTSFTIHELSDKYEAVVLAFLH